jgi:hypothetical protein
MTRTFQFNRLLAMGLCVSLACACGDDEKSKKEGTTDEADGGDGDGDGDADGEQEPSEPSDNSPDGGNDVPNENKPEADAGAEDEKDAATDHVEPDAGGPEKTPGTLLNLPHNGEKISVCYGPDDCNGDDLTCYAAFGTAPGVCTEDCKEDADCAPIGGLAATCSSDGQCRVDCTGAGKGDGACPANMECGDVSNRFAGASLTPSYRCVYPADAGSNSVKLYGKCDRSHGAGDCQGALSCHTPSAPFTTPSGAGYCTESCEKETECQVPAGTTSVPLCTEGGACEFDCSGGGATCPQGMNCRDVDNNPITETFRCRFIE